MNLCEKSGLLQRLLLLGASCLPCLKNIYIQNASPSCCVSCEIMPSEGESITSANEPQPQDSTSYHSLTIKGTIPNNHRHFPTLQITPSDPIMFRNHPLHVSLPFPTTGSPLFTITSIEHVGFRILNPRPWARGRKRFNAGPPFTCTALM